MNTADARYNVMQSEALCGALERTVERALVALGENAPASVLEPCRLALDDARRLTERLHYCVRQCESLGVDLPA